MSMPDVFAIAIRWSTALVDPPSAMTTVMAFSNASRVIISEGLISLSSSSRMALAAWRVSSDFSRLTAGFDEEYGKDMPIASIAEAIVLAVYIPPQAPAPGQEFWI